MRRRSRWIILWAIASQALCAIAITIDSHALLSTPMHGLLDLLQHQWAVVIALCAAVVMATIGIADSRRSVIWFLPQLFLLSISGLRACTAIAHSAYADGVIRNSMFMLSDQIWMVFGVICYQACVLDLYAGGLWRNRIGSQ